MRRRKQARSARSEPQASEVVAQARSARSEPQASEVVAQARSARSARGEPQASEVRRPRSRRDRRGFTLFEVLAAVLIFGLVYTVLAEVAIKSVYAEGDTDRRLTASLIADRALLEQETQLDEGIAPELGETEIEEGIYRIRTSVTPFDGSVFQVAPRETVAAGAPAAPAPSLLAAASSSGAPLLLTLDVEVSWTDGLFDRSLRRTTYGVNWEAAAPLLEDLQPAEELAQEPVEDVEEAP
ncbi:MAG: prepilin-type N-terminal cleavage/methylation domain-containing protein [Deltaproteobacteria bacterium]|nr:MAG: prepilin-type N-terminal cleavage/methylation domain-containing protein [Deltaproteobacteria bacterium]